MDQKNYEITQGDSFVLQVTYLNAASAAVNLTGYSAVFAVADRPGGTICASATVSNISASGTTGDGISVLNPASGVFLINLTPEKTNVLNLPRSAYQLQITSPLSINSTLLQGWFLVNAGVIS